MRTCECKVHQGGEQLQGGSCGNSWSPTAGLGSQQPRRSHGKCGVTAVLGAHSRSGPSGHGRGHTQHAVVPAQGRTSSPAVVPVPPPHPSSEGMGCTVPCACG